MRDYFKNIILNLYIYCGNRQAEKMTDDESKMLLDALCRVSAIYNYIPEEEQKRIIDKCLLEDKEYQNINARLISKWLEVNSKKFFTEEAHKETVVFEFVTGEERAKWLEKWKQALDKIDSSFTVKPVSNAELMREKMLGNQTDPTKYIPDPEQVHKKKLHQDYIKANYDPLTGNCLETWMPEDEWIKNRATT